MLWCIAQVQFETLDYMDGSANTAYGRAGRKMIPEKRFGLLLFLSLSIPPHTSRIKRRRCFWYFFPRTLPFVHSTSKYFFQVKYKIKKKKKQEVWIQNTKCEEEENSEGSNGKQAKSIKWKQHRKIICATLLHSFSQVEVTRSTSRNVCWLL